MDYPILVENLYCDEVIEHQFTIDFSNLKILPEVDVDGTRAAVEAVLLYSCEYYTFAEFVGDTVFGGSDLTSTKMRRLRHIYVSVREMTDHIVEDYGYIGTEGWATNSKLVAFLHTYG